MQKFTGLGNKSRIGKVEKQVPILQYGFLHMLINSGRRILVAEKIPYIEIKILWPKYFYINCLFCQIKLIAVFFFV